MGVLIWIIVILLLLLILFLILGNRFAPEEILGFSSNNNPSDTTQSADQIPDNFLENQDENEEINSDSDKTNSGSPANIEIETDTSTTENESSQQRIEDSSMVDLEPSEENQNNKEETSLPFEPIHTFEPDEDQWTTLHQELRETPWVSQDPDLQEKYDDRIRPQSSSKALFDAIEWLKTANTEAIHQQEEYRKFHHYLVRFIEEPRGGGVEAVKDQEWRKENPSITRIIGDRLLMMAVGMSCYGPMEMDLHRDTLAELLNTTWNDDGLEHPLLFQAIGRLGLLTPTSLNEVQPKLTRRIEGRVPRGHEPSRREIAAFHGLLLAVATGPEYPLQHSVDNLPRTWHWDGNTPPFARWDQMLPILYTLWIYHWVQNEPGSALRDIGAMLGSWWDENPPKEDFFEENPEVWEGILMFLWATVPAQKHAWNQLDERYQQQNIKDENLQVMTDTYFNWADQLRREAEPPSESFTGHRLPPIEWIRPLPSDLIRNYSQPSFEYPKSWQENFVRLDEPDTDSLNTE